MKKEILQLYPEDFCKTHDWEAICEQCNVPTTSNQIVIEFVRTGESEDTLQEIKD